jgi:hypothetical protein
MNHVQPQLLQENFVHDNNWTKPNGSNIAAMIEEIIRLLIGGFLGFRNF